MHGLVGLQKVNLYLSKDVVDQVVQVIAVLRSFPLFIHTENVIDLGLLDRSEELLLFVCDVLVRRDASVQVLPSIY